MYQWILFLHSWFRWAVLLKATAFGARLVSGYWKGRAWTEKDDRWAQTFGVTFTLQIVIGMILYFLSPLPWAAFSMGKPFLKNRILRFFAIEHITTLVCTWFVYVLGTMAILRADPSTRFRRMHRLYWVTLFFIILSIPWPGLLHERPLFRWIGRPLI